MVAKTSFRTVEGRLGQWPWRLENIAPASLLERLVGGDPDAIVDPEAVLATLPELLPPCTRAEDEPGRLVDHRRVVRIPEEWRGRVRGLVVLRNGPRLAISRFRRVGNTDAPNAFEDSSISVRALGNAPGKAPRDALDGSGRRYSSEAPGFNVLRFFANDELRTDAVSFWVLGFPDDRLVCDLDVLIEPIDAKPRAIYRGKWRGELAAELPFLLDPAPPDAFVLAVAEAAVRTRDRDVVNDVLAHYHLHHPEYESMVFEAMNRALPPGFGVTFHGVRPLHDLARGAETAHKVRGFCEWFETTLDLPTYLTSGALLGAVRGNALLPHDDDLDVAYVSRETEPANLIFERERIREVLESAGCRVVDAMGALFKVDLPGPDGLSVDLFSAHATASGSFRGFPLEVDALDVGEILPRSTVPLHDVPVPAPRLPERLLEVNYGPSWRMPDPTYRFPWTKTLPGYRYFLEHTLRHDARAILPEGLIEAAARATSDRVPVDELVPRRTALPVLAAIHACGCENEVERETVIGFARDALAITRPDALRFESLVRDEFGPWFGAVASSLAPRTVFVFHRAFERDASGLCWYRAFLYAAIDLGWYVRVLPRCPSPLVAFELVTRLDPTVIKRPTASRPVARDDEGRVEP